MSTAIKLHLCDSRILVPIFDTPYFESHSCRQEISHMREREDDCGFRSPTDPRGLIVPVHRAATKYFPDAALALKGHPIVGYHPSLIQDPTDPDYRAFKKAVAAVFADIQIAIEHAKEHQHAWQQLNGARYLPFFVRKPIDAPSPPIGAAFEIFGERLPRLVTA